MKLLVERKKRNLTYMVYSISAGMSISFIPGFMELDPFIIGYYFGSAFLLIMINWLLRADRMTIAIILLVLFVNFTLLFFSFNFGYLNNFDFYFFPLVMGIFFVLNREIKFLFICLGFTLICWAFLLYYANFIDTARYPALYLETNSYRIFNLLGVIVVTLIFGRLLFNSQTEYERGLEKNQERLESDLVLKSKLLRELHHRIKNNLNMISNLLFLKSYGMTNKALLDFVKETNLKIISISKIHEQLLQMEIVEDINIKNYLEELINEIIKSQTERPDDYQLKLSIQEITLNMDKTVTLGLIVNEIISNIIKHAYTTGEKGIITCRITQSNERITVIIGDCGKGMNSQQGKSIGLQLIHALVESLAGNINEDHSKGVLYTIEFHKT